MSKYSAGLTSDALWVSEFKKCIELYQSGLTSEDIRQKSDEENVLQLPTKKQAKRATGNLIVRITALPNELVDLFPQLDINNQKIVALLSFMLTNQLVDDFMYEVYRDELILGDGVLEDYEVQSFMVHKQGEIEKISEWSDQTIKRLKGTLKTLLRDAGLLKKEKSNDAVIQTYLDFRLEDEMHRSHLDRQLLSFKGGI